VGMGDQVFPTRQEADNWIHSLRDLLDFEFDETVVCESVEDSVKWLSPVTHAGISVFMFLSRHNGTLIPLKAVPAQQRNRGLAIALVLAVMAMIYGLKVFLEFQTEIKAVQATNSAKLTKEKHRQNVLDHPEMYFPRIWADAPEAGETLAHAVKAILGLPLSVNGWLFEGASVDGKRLEVSWAFKPGADYIHLPFNSHIDTPQKAVSSSTLPVWPPRSFSGGLLTRDECTKLLFQSTQLLSARLSLNFQLPDRRNIDGMDLVCPWVKGDWELSGLPSSIIYNLSFPLGFIKIPGLTINVVSLKEGVWTLKGEIYATY
ncbi:MAG: type 4b pilus protein PilO2, partial [Desulfovibrionaceae bacterium]|nr:type 4b pilus protein PilO2 [Desulfovibrionaceae bacterium]